MSDGLIEDAFYGLWGLQTVVLKTRDGFFRAVLDADEFGIIEGNLCDTPRLAIASVLYKAARKFEGPDE